ncbi:MAG: hypothetical protein O7A06_02615, partial [Acidobacteria bacterium]|nr:hypothetical protein [Acidobacteriota bacterium]
MKNKMYLPHWVRKRPILAVSLSIAFVVFITGPVWLAQVWPLFSNRPFVEVMQANQWGWAVIGPLYGWFSVVLLGGCFALFFTILGASLRSNVGRSGN